VIRVIIISFILALYSLTGHAQSGVKADNQPDIFHKIFPDGNGNSEIKVIQDEKLDEILIRYLEINRHRNGIPSYWIRIYSGSGHDARDKAYQTKAKFLKKYEGVKDKVIYDDPNFKVYVGGYRIKSDALKLLKTIQRDFPTAFIVYDVIGFPDLQITTLSKD
jgi:hypothetical protein